MRSTVSAFINLFVTQYDSHIQLCTKPGIAIFFYIVYVTTSCANSADHFLGLHFKFVSTPVNPAGVYFGSVQGIYRVYPGPVSES